MKTFTETPQLRSSWLKQGKAGDTVPHSFLFDFAGICRPAKETPGNFLETESLSNGKVVFAIGDTGPLPDPLPVLCVRHYFRRCLPREDSDPAPVAKIMNALIYDCCPADCCLTCFYGQYTRDTRVLRYVNAGHDAPLLIRSNPDEVVRLETGGPVFGLKESPRYRERMIVLKPGDRLVAFTPGVIDALASHNNQSAERALIALVRNCAQADAAQLAYLILAECECVCSGTQTDRSVLVASVDSDQISAYAATAAFETNACAELAVA